jgi:hypothetical protein
MLHSLLSIRDLPAVERHAWRSLFDYYIFQTDGEPRSFLPTELGEIFRTMTPDTAQMLLTDLQDSLRRKQAPVETAS